MLLTELSVKNFLSFQDAVWSPSRLNVLIGPNASGKSNLVSLLDMIKQSANGSLGEYVQNQGGMESLLWDGQGKIINLSVRFECGAKELPTINARSGLHYRFSLSRSANASWYAVSSEQLFISSSDQKTILQKANQQANLPSNNVKRADETLLSQQCLCFSKPEIDQTFKNMLRSWAIHHGFRTDAEAPVRRSAITRFETEVSGDGSNLVSVLHTLYSNNRDFKQTLDSTLFAVFGEAFDEVVFPPASDHRVQLGIRWKGLKKVRSSSSLSDGTLRFLYLITILENPNPPALIVIEEPEVGLHPSMLAVVTECAVEASKRSQVVFTTHSTDFLDTYKRTLPSVTVCTNDGGKTSLKILAGDKLDYWMKVYSLGEFHKSGAAEAVR